MEQAGTDHSRYTRMVYALALRVYDGRVSFTRNAITGVITLTKFDNTTLVITPTFDGNGKMTARTVV